MTASLNYGMYANGLQQNIIFLSDLLLDLGFNVYIAVNHTIDECVCHPAGIPIIEQHEIENYTFDYILQTSFFIRDPSLRALKLKNHKLVNVHIQYGNRMFADIENCKSQKMRYISMDVDEVWVSPHYNHSIPYLKSIYKTNNVFIIPYIWTPKYISLNENNTRYKPNTTKNVAILEPNISVTKNCLPAILIAEELCRDKKHRNLFERLFVYCSKTLQSSKHFRCWMWNLDIEKLNKIIFQDREDINTILSSHCNVILSHQLMNGLNYIYLEAMYLDIPFVHNSEYIKDCGFYYPNYDIQTGAKQLQKALEIDSDPSLSQKLKTIHQKTLYQFSPKNPYIIEQYKKLFKCN
jgi:hypothetical protein